MQLLFPLTAAEIRYQTPTTLHSIDFNITAYRYEVSFSIVDGKQVVLYPNNDEPVNVLNMKRGIISSLLVPDETQQTSNMVRKCFTLLQELLC